MAMGTVDVWRRRASGTGVGDADATAESSEACCEALKRDIAIAQTVPGAFSTEKPEKHFLLHSFAIGVYVKPPHIGSAAQRARQRERLKPIVSTAPETIHSELKSPP